MIRRKCGTAILLCGLTAFIVGGGVLHGGEPPADPDYRIVNPGNTGIPGNNNMQFVKFGPDGRLWAHGRDAFWQQGGVAALDFATERWKTYSSAETPLDQWCYDMAFAADGSSWIACDNTVVHLAADGETMTGHTPASTGVLVTGPHADISIAPNGHVWAANNGSVDLGGGLFEFDGTQWTKHEEPWMVTWTGFGIAPPLNVLARANGDVWASFLSAPSCMGRYRDGEWTQVTTGPFIIDMVETGDGVLYGAAANGVYRMNDLTGQWEWIGPFGSSSIAIDPNNDFIYIVRNLNQIMRYNGSTWTTFATFPGWVGGFTVAPNGDVWIAAEAWASHNDLHHYNAAGQLQRVYNRSNTGMITYFPPGMYRDHDGRMWFTDAEYGASRLEPNENWRNFGQYNGQEEVYPFWVSPVGLPWWQTPGADFWTESVDQVLNDSQGNFWLRGPNIISRSDGADLSQWTTWPPGQGGFPGSCDSVGEDAQGNIWLGNPFVVFRLEGTSWTEVPIGIPGQFAPVGLTQGGDGELYASRVATVYHVLGDSITPLYSLPEGFGVITDLEVDVAGNMWIGTPNNGLVFWDGTASTIYTPANSGLAELAVQDITLRSSDDLVAVSTSQQFTLPYDGGVAVFDGSTWTSYDYGESFLPHYAVGDVQFDADGHLWVGVLNHGTVQVLIGDGQGQIPGDMDGDGDVDLADFSTFQVCFGEGPIAPECAGVDFDQDDDVDGADFATFEESLLGPK